MKKALIVILIILMSCPTVLAESINVTEEDFTLDLNKTFEIDSSLFALPSYESEEVDAVTRDGEVFTVDTGKLKIVLDLAEFPTFLCFTQDLYASFDAYLSTNDPKSMIQALIDDGIDFYLIDLETGMSVFIYLGESDNMSVLVGDFSLLSSKDQTRVASLICSKPVIEQCGETPWIVATETAMLTIFNEQYVIVEFGGSDDPAADLADTLDLLSHMRFE